MLSGCASLELTQSRYGNGLGLSLKSSKKEIKNAEYIKLRERQEYANRKYKTLQSVSKTPETIAFTEERGKSVLVDSKIDKTLNNNEKIRDISISNASTSKVNNFALQGIVADAQDEPVIIQSSKESQGNMGNLGYLGGVLVIAGLVLMLLGIGGGWSVLVLGVILIVLAYFLG